MKEIPLIIQIPGGMEESEVQEGLADQLEILAKHIREVGYSRFTTTSISTPTSKVKIVWRDKEEGKE